MHIRYHSTGKTWENVVLIHMYMLPLSPKSVQLYLLFKASLLLIFRFLQPFIASWKTLIWLTSARLTCPCNTLRTSNSFGCCDWQRATPDSHVQNRPLVCSIGCPCSHRLFCFSVLHSNKTINTITYKIQNCFVSYIINYFYILDIRYL